MAFLHLYTAATPNGYRPSIFLEELKLAYPGTVDYDVRAIKLQENEHKAPWYIEINPNGVIPALVDDNRRGFKVFESSAITLYLAQHYDKDFKLSFDPIGDADNYSEALQWIFFCHGGIGPMTLQAFHFALESEKIPYAIDRYVTEIKRLFSVVENRLADREYLVGPGKGKYSIADINAFPWMIAARLRLRQYVPDFEKESPYMTAWFARMNERAAVQSGLGVPARRW